MKKIVLNPDNGIVVTQCHGYSLSGQYFSEKINIVWKCLSRYKSTDHKDHDYFKEQLLFSFLCIVKQKKNFGAIRKILKIFIFGNLHHKKGLKGGISIDADSGPPRYVL